MFVTTYTVTRRHYTEHRTLHFYRRENVKSQKLHKLYGHKKGEGNGKLKQHKEYLYSYILINIAK
jgi:hypothetical protein